MGCWNCRLVTTVVGSGTYSRLYNDAHLQQSSPIVIPDAPLGWEIPPDMKSPPCQGHKKEAYVPAFIRAFTSPVKACFAAHIATWLAQDKMWSSLSGNPSLALAHEYGNPAWQATPELVPSRSIALDEVFCHSCFRHAALQGIRLTRALSSYL